jgi:hypothetical protein
VALVRTARGDCLAIEGKKRIAARALVVQSRVGRRQRGVGLKIVIIADRFTL